MEGYEFKVDQAHLFLFYFFGEKVYIQCDDVKCNKPFSLHWDLLLCTYIFHNIASKFRVAQKRSQESIFVFNWELIEDIYMNCVLLLKAFRIFMVTS